jgi:DNA-binding NarL/FixJ family response regulator
MFHDIDVTAIAAALDVPTLVVHSRRDARVPFDEGRRLAALIPGAQFVPLESANHILVEGEPAWAGFLDVVNGALATSATTPAPAGAGALTAAEAAVLELVARGLDNHAIALRLGKSEKTVRNQVSTIFDKLGVRTRAEAIVRAIDRRDA